MTKPRDAQLFINRELSQLEFQFRVLAQAKDPAVPLLERLRYLCISCTNLDEFFEIRVAALRHFQQFGGSQTMIGPDGLSPSETLARIRARTIELIDQQYTLWNKVLRPQLRKAGVSLVMRDEWNAKQRRWLREYFQSELLPVLSPLGLDPAHPFPRVLNKSLNFIVSLKGRDAFGRQGGIAVVQAPRALPRLIQLPASCASGPNDFVFLSSIIHTHVGELFPGMEVTGCYQFRVTRNSELFVDDEEAEDLLRAVEGELRSRRYG